MRKRRAQSVGHSLRLLGEQPLAPTLFRRFANLGRFVAPYAVLAEDPRPAPISITDSRGGCWTATITEVVSRNRQRIVVRDSGRP